MMMMMMMMMNPTNPSRAKKSSETGKSETMAIKSWGSQDFSQPATSWSFPYHFPQLVQFPRMKNAPHSAALWRSHPHAVRRLISEFHGRIVQTVWSSKGKGGKHWKILKCGVHSHGGLWKKGYQGRFWMILNDSECSLCEDLCKTSCAKSPWQVLGRRCCARIPCNVMLSARDLHGRTLQEI